MDSLELSKENIKTGKDFVLGTGKSIKKGALDNYEDQKCTKPITQESLQI